MKLKTLFKCLGWLAVCSSLIPVGMSFNNKTLSVSNQNVGNLTANEQVEATFSFTLRTQQNDYSISCTNKEQATIAHIPSTHDGKNVAYVADDGFKDATRLKEVYFDEDPHLVNMGRHAFANCTSLIAFHTPATLKYVNSEAFLNCSSLKVFVFNANWFGIGAEAFKGCNNLKEIYFNWTEKEIDAIIENIKVKNKVRDFCDTFGETNGTQTINKKDVTVHIPKDASDELLNKYKDNFKEYDSNKDLGVGFDSSSTHWVKGALSPSVLAPILGGIFGGIVAIGLVSTGFLFWKKSISK